MREETVRELGEIAVANGPSSDKGPATLLLTERLGGAYAALAAAYCDGGRKPLSARRCGQIVSGFGAPSSILWDLEQKELLIPDRTKTRGRERLIEIGVCVLVLRDDGTRRQVWPSSEENPGVVPSEELGLGSGSPTTDESRRHMVGDAPAPTASDALAPRAPLSLEELQANMSVLDATIARDRAAYSDWMSRREAALAKVSGCRLALEAACAELEAVEACAVEDPDAGKASQLAAAFRAIMDDYEAYRRYLQN